MYTEKELKAQYRRLRPQFKSVWEELTPGFEDNIGYIGIRESLVRVNEAVRALKEDSKGDFFNKLGEYTRNNHLPLEWYSTYKVETAEKILFFFIERKTEEKDVLDVFSHLIGKTNDLSLITEIYEDCESQISSYSIKNDLFYAIKELIPFGLDVSDIKQFEVLKKLAAKVYLKHLLYGFKKVLNNEIDLKVLENRLYNNEKYLCCYTKSKGYSYVSYHESYDIDNKDKLYLETLLNEEETIYSILCDFIQVAKYRAEEKKEYSGYGYNMGSRKINVEEEIENEFKEFLFNPLYKAFKGNRLVSLKDLQEAFENSKLVQNLREKREKDIHEEGLKKLKSREERGELDNLKLNISDIKVSVDNVIFNDTKLNNFIENINQEFDEQSPSRLKARRVQERAIKRVEKIIKNAKEQAKVLSKQIDLEEAVKKYDNYILNNLRGVSVILTTDLTRYSSVLKYGAEGKIRNIYERKYYIDFEDGRYNNEIYDSGFEIVDAEYLAVREVVNAK